MRVISIDPSIHKLGFAVADERANVVEASLISINEDTPNWESAALMMADAVGLAITTALDEHDDYIVVSEMPSNWFGARGEASKDSEAVQKLYYYVGYQMSLIRMAFPKLPCFLVNPTTWKGQVPKAITQKRVLALLKTQGHDLKDIDNNVADAIMIGQYAYRNYHRLTRVAQVLIPLNVRTFVG